MPTRSRDYVLAFASGGILTLMVLFNGQFAQNGTALFASWAAHGLGLVAALALLMLLPSARGGTGREKTGRGNTGRGNTGRGQVPFWAYLGGLSGAVTVMATSTTVNSALMLSGTLALGILGQISFGLASDHFGLFGMPRRRPGGRDLMALALVLSGSALIIFGPGLVPWRS